MSGAVTLVCTAVAWAATEAPRGSVVLWSGDDQWVKIEPQDDPAAVPNDHPAQLGANAISTALGALRVNLVDPDTGNQSDRPVFTPNELQNLTQHVASGLAKAGPRHWPPPLWYRTHWPAETAMMRLRSRQDPTAARERRYDPVPLDSIARPMLLAATTGEDDRFWEHGGVDYLAILRALGYRRREFDWNSARDRAEFRRALGRAWSRRDQLRGASTITQQLAKNLYLSPSRNPLRKVKEAVTAYRLEAALGKRRILELYLNVAELGRETWGVEAASQAYFDRPARRISRSQAAALAGSLPFPLRSNPGYRPGRMRWRQNLILRRMGGEPVEVPREPPDESPPPVVPELVPDTLAPPAPDSALEVRPVPVDTLLPPAPPLPDSTS